jgi:hypothetical protein
MSSGKRHSENRKEIHCALRGKHSIFRLMNIYNLVFTRIRNFGCMLGASVNLP